MSKSVNSMSIIVTGSELNHRTFHEDESWSSLQSTILAGNMSRKAEETMADKLDTVEEEQKVDCNMDYSNILNVNIDALDDDEVFFDCPNLKSPMFQKIRASIREKPTPKTNVQPSSSHLLPTATTALSTNTCSSPDSGFDLGDDRTGDMLAKILEDFNQLTSHAQFSTPKHCCEHLSELTTTTDNLKKKLNFTDVQKSPDVVNKEKRLEGKYSKDVNVKPALSAVNLRKTPRPKRRRPRVSEICAFFENVSRTNEQSRSSCSVARKSAAAPKKLASKTRSPTYHTKEMFKILKNKSLRTSYNSSGTASFLLRNQPKPRPSSCSELPSERSGKSSKGQPLLSVSSLGASKSRSMNDLSTVNASKLEVTAESKMRQRTPVHKKSPKKKARGGKGVSEINKRRSLQGLIHTPVKPVKELRCVFSPKNAAVNDAKKIIQSSSNVALIVNQTRKISDKRQITLPCILITKE